jgi:all-trans-retinol 13,14-reductase
VSEVHDPTARTRERTRNTVPEQVDVAIIGAGTGGLTAGAYLAEHGLKVAVFDQHYVAGGCATQFARGSGADRYCFDVGIHYVGDCGEGGLIPEMLGQLDIEQQFVPMDPDGFDTLVFPDFTFKVPVGHDAYRARLVEFFPEERAGIDRYVKFLKQVDHAARQVQPRDTVKTPAALASILFKAPRAVLSSWKTLAQVLDGVSRNPHLRSVIGGQHGDYGLPPSEVSAIFHAGISNHFLRGAYYPKGGGQMMSDKLAARIEELGGSIHLRKGIERVVVENGRATGVVTETAKGVSHRVQAKVVLSNADIKATLFDLVGREHLPARYAKKADNWTMSSALFLTCLGVEADMGARGMRASNYFIADDYDVDGAYRKGREPGELLPLGAYITSATRKDPGTPGHAPEGIENVEIMTLLAGEPEAWGMGIEDAQGWGYKRDGQYAEAKQAAEDNLIDRLEKLFPGTKEKIVFRESATPMSHIRYTRATGGTGYGIGMTPKQMDSNRVHPRSPLKGLYLCGASSRHGFGVVGTMLSGRDAARRITEDLGKKLKH